jgi:hypothetical protein
MGRLFSLVFSLVVGLSSFSASAASSKLSSSAFIAAVVSYDGNVEVWLNPRSYWNEVGGLAASYSDEEWEMVSKIVEDAGLCNVAESTYESCGNARNADQIKADLVKAGVEVHAEFQKWAEGEVLGL